MKPHTPGPWSVPHFAAPDTNCACEYVLTDLNMGAVASVHCSGDGDDWKSHGDNPKFAEAVANGHLIAAAPELLAAVEEILSWTKDDADLMGRLDKPAKDTWPDVIACRASFLRAVIAKATCVC